MADVLCGDHNSELAEIQEIQNMNFWILPLTFDEPLFLDVLRSKEVHTFCYYSKTCNFHPAWLHYWTDYIKPVWKHRTMIKSRLIALGPLNRGDRQCLLFWQELNKSNLLPCPPPTTSSVADPGFPRGGAPTPEGGAPTYYLANFSRKLHENKEILGPRGGRASLAPPLDPPMILVAAKWNTCRSIWNANAAMLRFMGKISQNSLVPCPPPDQILDPLLIIEAEQFFWDFKLSIRKGVRDLSRDPEIMCFFKGNMIS